MLVGCGNFDQFDPPKDGALQNDAAQNDAPLPTDDGGAKDAAWDAPIDAAPCVIANCTQSAKQCSNQCNNQYQNCTDNCGGQQCLKMCQNQRDACTNVCVQKCTSCTADAGCANMNACQMALQ